MLATTSNFIVYNRTKNTKILLGIFHGTTNQQVLNDISNCPENKANKQPTNHSEKKQKLKKRWKPLDHLLSCARFRNMTNGKMLNYMYTEKITSQTVLGMYEKMNKSHTRTLRNNPFASPSLCV